ncbi:MAG: hypothetical protein LUO93_09535 [Methanomicrobiales archaeon]|nr:hypothetical protein [Methanomicrobiales archaeon]
MPNMSYCRFHNTLADLRECVEHMDDELSPAEANDKERLIKLCCEIAENYGEVHADC